MPLKGTTSTPVTFIGVPLRDLLFCVATSSSGILHGCLARENSLGHLKSFINQAGYWPRFFFNVFIDLDFDSVPHLRITPRTQFQDRNLQKAYHIPLCGSNPLPPPPIKLYNNINPLFPLQKAIVKS